MPASAVEPIRVLLVDDHPALRDGITSMLGSEVDMVVVGEATDGLEAVARYRDLKPDVALMDVQMPRMNGVTAITEIRKEYSRARIIVLTTYSGDAQAMRALRAGAVGYMLKSTLRTDIVEAIRRVAAGGRFIPPEIAQEIALHAADDTLSERELGILRLVAEGLPNRGIAARLGLSEDTIKSHLKTIFLKLDVSDRTLAVTTAVRRGIITL